MKITKKKDIFANFNKFLKNDFETSCHKLLEFEEHALIYTNIYRQHMMGGGGKEKKL